MHKLDNILKILTFNTSGIKVLNADPILSATAPSIRSFVATINSLSERVIEKIGQIREVESALYLQESKLISAIAEIDSFLDLEFPSVEEVTRFPLGSGINRNT